MYVRGNSVKFDEYDMNFVTKYGLMKATEMVLDFACFNSHPFIIDTYQLPGVLDTNRKKFFHILKNINMYYRKIVMKKKNGGTRTLYAPESPLKHMQKRINQAILSQFSISEYATAYRKGGRLSDNASPHCGKKYLLKIDLEDFFGSISFQQVYNAAFNTKYFPHHIGTMLATLCCKDDCLPQGAPTSPALSNLVMRHFDDTIGNWCKRKGISYTRYSDDITFSGDAPLYNVYIKARNMLEDMGFELNEKKTHFITSGNRQTVTGLTVNEKVAVSSEYKRKLRQEIYYILKYGISNSIIHTNNTNYLTPYGQPESHRYVYNIIGRIQYVLQIEPDNKYFKDAFEKLKTLF